MSSNKSGTKNLSESELLFKFRKYDRDGNGFITKKEIEDVLRGIGARFSDEEIAEMISSADTNADGKIDYAEFCKKKGLTKN